MTHSPLDEKEVSALVTLAHCVVEQGIFPHGFVLFSFLATTYPNHTFYKVAACWSAIHGGLAPQARHYFAALKQDKHARLALPTLSRAALHKRLDLSTAPSRQPDVPSRQPDTP